MRPAAPLRSPSGSSPPSPPTSSTLRAAAATPADLGTLRRDAEALAKERNERPTTTHLLVVLAARPGLPAELLAERRVVRETLLKALRVATDDHKDAIDALAMRAREIAGRVRRLTPNAPEVDATHVLHAICVERGCAAHKTLTQLGVDVARLRSALTQHATGSVEPRRRVQERALEAPPSPRTPTGHAPSRGLTALRPLPTPEPRRELRPSRETPSTPPPAPQPPGALAEPIAPIAPIAPKTPGADEERAAPPPKPALKLPKNVRRHPKALTEPTRFDLDPKSAPTLCQLGVNLTAAAARGELDPVVGRDAEIDHALDVLAKRNANNPCLVGAPGVGKTAIAWGVARKIAAGEPGVHGLDDRIVVELPIGELLAGTGVRGALAERLGAIRKEVAAARGRIVLFLDEVHALVGGDAGEEAANELKTALARGELPCIAATTPSEYRRTIERDAALARRFSVVEIDELDPVAAKSVVESASGVLAAHHGVAYDAGAKEGAIAWTVRYVPSRALPDKALAALDLAGARARRNGLATVTREAVADVVSEMADVPVSRLLERDAERFLELEKHLSARVVGHTAAIAKIAKALRRGAAGLRGRRPLFTALLLGPTGVGKTETAKAVAEVLFHDGSAMTRIDLSEYSEQHAVARLIGAPPGYVGHDDGGQLTEAVRRRPYQVVLFDEMEKAHRDVLETLLQLLDEGRMTDGRGRTIDFTNTVVILTSNLGSSLAAERPGRRLGFGAAHDEAASAVGRDEQVIAAARSALPPELFNRFDEVIVYAPLVRADAIAIARLALERLGDELRKARGLSLQVDPEAIELLLDQGGFDPSLGGRPIRREIGRAIEGPLAELLLRGDAKPGDVVWVTVEDGHLVVDLVR